MASATFADGATVIAFGKTGAILQWPVLATHVAIAEHTGRLAAGCLTAEERSHLKLAAPRPDWCSRIAP